MSCKHRIALLDGDAGALVSKNASDLKVLAALAEGTDVARCLAEVRSIDAELAAVKRKLSDAKHALARAMSL